jgi:hypothetical protein
LGSELPSPIGMEFDPNAFERISLTTWNSVVVPVVVIGPELFQGIGTAFNISPDGLWVTARHVINEAVAVAQRSPGAHIAILWTGSGVDEDDVPDLLGGPIPVLTITKDDTNGSDLALLRAGMLRDQEVVSFPCVKLSARLPKVGTKISAVGYARFSVDSDVSTPEIREVEIDPNFHFSSGEITQVFRGGRDTTLLPTACFETSARFDAGMSGGPVFDQEGAVCGVVASSLEFDSSDEGFTSYASATPFIFILGQPDGDETLTVYDMVRRDLVSADGSFELLKVIERDDGKLDLSFPCQK